MQRCLRLLEKQPTYVRERHAVTISIQQPNAEPRLQCLDLHAQSGLHDRETLCGTPEMQFLGQGDKGPQMLELQGGLRSNQKS